jgi:hypothetical protein
MKNMAIQFLQKIYEIRYETTAILFFASSVSLFKIEISFKFSRRKFANRFFLSNFEP